MVSVRHKTTSIDLIQKFTWQTCDAQHPIHQSAKKMEKIVIIVPFVLLLSQSGCGRVMSEKTHRTGRTHHFLGAWYHFPSHHYLMSFGSSRRPSFRTDYETTLHYIISQPAGHYTPLISPFHWLSFIYMSISWLYHVLLDEIVHLEVLCKKSPV